jgi:cell division transport system ATP-binding protein
MIRFDRVAKRYPNGREALSGVSFEIAAGEMVFLTGRSGAGKSTVLRLISLLERPTRGQVTVNGKDTGRLPSRLIPAFRRQIGVVFQDHKLLIERSIYDNVALPLIVAHTNLREVDKRVRAALDQVGLLDRLRAMPLELSVGEQQRVGIARAVVSKPPLLVADEPTGNLDPALSREVMNLFRRFRDVGVTVVVATHDMQLVREAGQREIVLADGRLQDTHLADVPTLEVQR